MSRYIQSGYVCTYRATWEYTDFPHTWIYLLVVDHSIIHFISNIRIIFKKLVTPLIITYSLLPLLVESDSIHTFIDEICL